MKVDLVSGISSQSSVEVSPRTAGAASPATAAAVAQDHTTLSTSSQAIQSLVGQAMASPEVRQAKVDALRQQVASGSYHPDPRRIAQGILNEQQ